MAQTTQLAERPRGVSSVADVEAIEAAGWPAAAPVSTYEMIERAARLSPSAPALSFFLTTDSYRQPESWTYRELQSEITRTANALHSLGAERDTVIAYILPNLPETHFVAWGGRAAGIVFGVNQMLEVGAIHDLLRTANAQIVVTVAPSPGTDTSQKVIEAIRDVESVRHLVLVDLAERVQGPRPLGAAPSAEELGLPAGISAHDFGTLLRGQPDDHLVSGRVIDPDDLSSFFGTGGTTGLPKIAMRTHRNEVANAISTSKLLSGVFTAGKNLFCGLPMFHVNAVMATGLMPFSTGAHVVLGTAHGYRADGLLGRFWEIVQHYRINFFSGVPTIYAALLESPTEGYDLGCLEYGICGAAPYRSRSCAASRRSPESRSSRATGSPREPASPPSTRRPASGASVRSVSASRSSR